MRANVRYWVIVSAAIALALYLRVAPLPNESLDGDELFSLRLASAESAQLWDAARQDLVHPPLYYLLLKLPLAVAGTESPGALRALSVAAGVGSLAVAALIGFFVPALRVSALVSVFLMALNTEHTFYSQQARSYALFCLLAGLLLLWALAAEGRLERIRYWIAGTALMAGLLWTHYVGLLYCLAALAPLAALPLGGGLPGAAVRRRAALALGAAFALFLPWLLPEIPVYLRKSGLEANLGWQGTPALYDLKAVFASYLGIPDFRGGTTAALLVWAALSAYAAVPRRRRAAETGLRGGDALPVRLWAVLGSMAALPPLLLFLAARSPLELPVFAGRHVFPSILPALLLAAYGLDRLRRRVRSRTGSRAALACGVLVLVGFEAAPLYRQWSRPVRQPYEAIARDLDAAGSAYPVYTTNLYVIGEPVTFYLGNGRRVEPLPGPGAGEGRLPEKFIVLYRPAVPREKEAAERLLEGREILWDRYYSGVRSPAYGTRLLLLAARAGWERASWERRGGPRTLLLAPETLSRGEGSFLPARGRPPVELLERRGV